ncbi:MAG: hypothetical protein AAFQ33_08330 [Pseudomonadota bacterium]
MGILYFLRSTTPVNQNGIEPEIACGAQLFAKYIDIRRRLQALQLAGRDGVQGFVMAAAKLHFDEGIGVPSARDEVDLPARVPVPPGKDAVPFGAVKPFSGVFPGLTGLVCPLSAAHWRRRLQVEGKPAVIERRTHGSDPAQTFLRFP